MVSTRSEVTNGRGGPKKSAPIFFGASHVPPRRNVPFDLQFPTSMQLTPPRSSPLAMLPTGPDPNIFQSMKKQYGDYLLPDEVYARGNANSPKEYHYKSRTKDQLRDGFGER